MTSVSTGDQLRVAQPFAAVLVLVRQTVNESGEVWSLGPLSPPGRLSGCRSLLVSTASTVRALKLG